MNRLVRVALTIGCFFTAIACYVFGVPVGGIAFIILGVIFEGLFWVGVFGKKKKFPSSESR
ncbi:hypothetical protein [Agarilytica rhodophyticola]|uniref:hypothetical protein n=1 Tax=Agarilytica rhodophyticola TaxID=1737490 RepID=UPI000B340F81|nr:hypothetical protein [Agarilytica rhodophyticola]